ncbi:MAG: hypothetical protein WBG50_12590 [Desulfomonilaceae bacterium]
MCKEQEKKETIEVPFLRPSTDETGRITLSADAMDTFAQAIPNLYSVTLGEIKGLFTAGEVNLMLDVSNGLLLMPMILGQHLSHEVEDGIDLNGLAEKWDIDRDALLEKLARLSTTQIAVLETVLNDFWYGADKSLDAEALLEALG